jgi:transketolase
MSGIDRLCVDTIRTLSMDAVQKAKSGHPGTPMAHVLWQQFAPCLATWERLQSEGIAARVVSMPSWELFDEQDESYRERILPAAIRARVSVEAGSTGGGERYVGTQGAMIGMTQFGASGPYQQVLREFGYTAENISAAARAQVAKWKGA